MLALNLAFSRKTEEQEGRKKKKCSKALYFSQTCSLQCKGQRPQACFRPSCASFFSTAFSDFECLWVTAMSDSESQFPFFLEHLKVRTRCCTPEALLVCVCHSAGSRASPLSPPVPRPHQNSSACLIVMDMAINNMFYERACFSLDCTLFVVSKTKPK